jgi:hypothetical protein
MVAIAERARQVTAWREVNKSVSPEVRAAWQEQIDTFLANRTEPNPYILSSKGTYGDDATRASTVLTNWGHRCTHRGRHPPGFEEGRGGGGSKGYRTIARN